MNVGKILNLNRLLSENRRLENRRHPMFERNMAMKVFSYIFIGFWAVYLFFFGIVFYFAFADASIEQYDMLNGGMAFLLIADFFVRFAFQETPAQEIKPYKLLPISERFLLNLFLLRIGASPYNLFWGFFLLPYSLLSIPFYHGWIGVVGFLFGWWLMFVLNAYWYLIWRSLVNRNVLYIIIPAVLWGGLVYWGYFADGTDEWLFEFTMHLGQEFIDFNVVVYILLLLVISVLFVANAFIQRPMVYAEMSKVSGNIKVKSSEMHLLNKFGIVGQYVKLEVKSTMRNLVVRKQFVYGLSCMALLSALFAFTDVYDGLPFMKAFICVYCFSCLGVMTLTSIMCAEGNYMDGLMSRKESVMLLLKAKYYFNCVLTLLPLLIMVMPIVEGKVGVVEAVGCLFFTTGVIFPFLFQLAVYNNTTLHLNEKITKAGRSTKAQYIVSMTALFVPMLVMYVLMSVFDVGVASVVMMCVGIIGTSVHKYWLRNIYVRFMKRRHVNMAGFRDTI